MKSISSSSPSSCQLFLIAYGEKHKNVSACEKLKQVTSTEKSKKEKGETEEHMRAIQIDEAEESKNCTQQETEDDLNEWQIIKLYHPSNLNIICEFLYKNNQIFQVQRCERSFGKCSALIGNWVISDGSLLIAYPIDTLFFLFPLLYLKRKQFTSLNDLCTFSCFGKNLNNSCSDDIGNDKDFEDNDISQEEFYEVLHNFKRCVLDASAVTRLSHVCDKLYLNSSDEKRADAYKEEIFYKINFEKIDRFLEKKVNGMMNEIEQEKLYFNECWITDSVAVKKADFSQQQNQLNMCNARSFQESMRIDKTATKQFCYSLISLYLCDCICEKLNFKHLLLSEALQESSYLTKIVHTTAENKVSKKTRGGNLIECMIKTNSNKRQKKGSEDYKNFSSITAFFKKT